MVQYLYCLIIFFFFTNCKESSSNPVSSLHSSAYIRTGNIIIRNAISPINVLFIPVPPITTSTKYVELDKNRTEQNQKIYYLYENKKILFKQRIFSLKSFSFSLNIYTHRNKVCYRLKSIIK